MQGRSREPEETERAEEETVAPGSGRAMGRPPLPREVARCKRVVTFVTEQEKATEQWLKRIPDDPGGLLRRKFLYQYKNIPDQQDSNEPW